MLQKKRRNVHVKERGKTKINIQCILVCDQVLLVANLIIAVDSNVLKLFATTVAVILVTFSRVKVTTFLLMKDIVLTASASSLKTNKKKNYKIIKQIQFFVTHYFIVVLICGFWINIYIYRREILRGLSNVAKKKNRVLSNPIINMYKYGRAVDATTILQVYRARIM